MASVAVLLLFLGVASGSERQSVARNSAAQTVVEKSLALGIDFGVRDVDAVDPARQDLASYSSAATWLTEQIQTADDTISQPPETFQVFLRDRDAALWIIVASLEKDQPEWNRDEDEQAAALLRPIMRLEKLLLATALYEERTGAPIQASRALEASWSLGRSLTGRLTIMDQLIAVAIQKLQAGALRKMKEPSLAWLGRLDGDLPWRRMVEAMFSEMGRDRSAKPSALADPEREVVKKAMGAVADGLRKAGPCGVAGLSDEEIWMPAQDALAVEISDAAKAMQGILKDIALPNLLNGVRRAGRNCVDRELTLRILELRTVKAASRDGRWPEKLLNDVSAVCPGRSYIYRRLEQGMEIQFDGPVEAPNSGPELPLTYRAGKHALAALPTPTPTPTPTPDAP